MKKIMCGLLLGLSVSAHAGWVVGHGNGLSNSSARVKGVASDWGNTGNFAIQVEGGSGPCTNNWVAFSKSHMDPEVYRNTFELAQLAFLHGFKVNVYNYANDDCSEADFIEVVRS